MEVEGRVRRSHKVFHRGQEVCLDHILSFLDAKSQLSARRVCKQWDESIQRQFHKKLALRHQLQDDRKKRTPAESPSLRINSKLFSSLKIQFLKACPSEDGTTAMNLQLDRISAKIRSTPEMTKEFRSLVIVGEVPKECLEHLVELGNTGLFQHLQELRLNAEVLWISENAAHTTFYQVVLANTFPKLTKLEIRIKSSQLMPNRLQSTFQEILDSAANVVCLTVANPVNLELQGLVKLKNLRFKKAKDEVAMNMILSTNDRLTSLELHHCGLQIASFLPALPKLEELNFSSNYTDTEEDTIPVNQFCPSQQIDWDKFPCLKKLTLCGELCCEPSLPGLINMFYPLPQTLIKLRLENFPTQQTFQQKHMTWLYNFIVNSPVSVTVIRFEDDMSFATLLGNLAKPVVTVYNQRQNMSRRREIEFHNGNYTSSGPFPLYGTVVNKLRRNWDHVRFVDFKVKLAATIDHSLNPEGQATTNFFA